MGTVLLTTFASKSCQKNRPLDTILYVAGAVQAEYPEFDKKEWKKRYDWYNVSQ